MSDLDLAQPTGTPPNIDDSSTGLSISRLFKVMDLFRHRAEPLTLAEISHALGLPKSSLLKLLKDLSHLGYLIEDPVVKSYFPSFQLSALGRDIEAALIGHYEYDALLSELRTRTRESVGFAVQDGVSVVHSAYLPGTQALNFNIEPGTRFPLYMAAAGRAILSALSEERFQRYLQYLAERREAGDSVPEEATLIRDIARVREDGYATTEPRQAKDLYSIAALAPLSPARLDRPLAISVGGPRDRMIAAQDHIIAALRAVLKRYYLHPDSPAADNA